MTEYERRIDRMTDEEIRRRQDAIQAARAHFVAACELLASFTEDPDDLYEIQEMIEDCDDALALGDEVLAKRQNSDLD